MAVLERLSDQDLKKYAGQWVAVKDGKVLVSALEPKDVVAWLNNQGKAADLVYRVPAKGEPTTWVY